MSEHYLEEGNLSIAWLRAVARACASSRSEVAPLIVAITEFDADGNPVEDMRVRGELEDLLARKQLQGVDTVASTIFPQSMWNPGAPREALFDRYRRIAPRLKAGWTSNRYGLYFERMILGGPKGHENQLEFAIDTYTRRKGVRRSVLQIGVFDPSRDHTTAAMRGFPCLQHVTFAPTAEGLCVNAFYASQYLIERAYGNYLGLCRLGRFVAHEMDMKLARLTCFIGIAETESKIAKRDLKSLLAMNTNVSSNCSAKEK